MEGEMKSYRKPEAREWVEAGFCAWLCTALLNLSWIYTGENGLAFSTNSGLMPSICLFVLLWLMFALIGRIRPASSGKVLMASVCLYSSACAAAGGNIWLLAGLAAVLLWTAQYLSNKPEKQSLAETGDFYGDKRLLYAAGLLFFIFVGGVTALRYMTFASPNFDFGIFSQMFERMKTTGLPITTCERNRQLSHFAVHISPVFYLMLPFYLLFPHPIALQLMQAAALALGILPLYGLCRHNQLFKKACTAVCFCYVLHPALAGGCFYDMHENFFLTPFLLCLLLSVEKKQYAKMALFTALVLLVKEDAAVYTAFTGLYLLASGREKKPGALMAAASVLYFLLAVTLLDRFGEGVMIGRYQNFLAGGQNFGSILKTVFINPGYTLAQCLQADRIGYLLIMALPLACLPFMGRKPSEYLLLGPFVLMNLMPDYEYQHSIDFQYNFGVLALFFYLFIRRLSQCKEDVRGKLLKVSLTVSCLMFLFAHADRLSYVGRWMDHRQQYRVMEEALERIPKEASVAASGFLTPHLYMHQELYEETAGIKTDYVALDLRDSDAKAVEEYEQKGYRCVIYEEGSIAVLAYAPDVNQNRGKSAP